MQSVPISSLCTISPSQQTTLKRANVHNVSDLILTAPADLARKCRISIYDVQSIIDRACRELAVRPLRLDDPCLIGRERFTTGDQTLDTALGGGIHTGMIWEVVGESAAGKTQLSLQLSLFVQLPQDLKGACGSACFLSTSWTLPTSRILEIVDSHPLLSPTLCGLADIHTLKTPSIPILHHVLSHTLPDFLEDRLKCCDTKPVKLVVIDALTELFHSANKTSSNTLAQRAKDLADISYLLHSLAHKYRLAVVVLNEVADTFEKPADSDSGRVGDVLYRDQARWFSRAHNIPGENKKEATLGLAWANQVNARVMLTRTDRMRHIDNAEVRANKRRRLEGESRSNTHTTSTDDQHVRLRHLSVIFSPVGPPASVDYIVTERGIVGLPEEDYSLITFSAPAQPTKPPGAVHRVEQLLATATNDSQDIIPSSQPEEQLLDLGLLLASNDDAANVRADEMEAEGGPQSDVDDWDLYWNDTDNSLYNSVDLDALPSSNPG